DVEALVASATESHTAFAPFRKRIVEFRGHDFEAFLQANLGRNVSQVKITAVDGYQVSLNDIEGRGWMLVTHEDGQPLELRTHGPLRLIQTDIGRRDPKNMSLFDDWIWMIERIEAVD
ncbi:MAG: hypothetical protein HWE12_09355, partial [Oceanospirillaceae bacterium]|nr:hypothetical protein [Oceanospirillaceae bacterium]